MQLKMRLKWSRDACVPAQLASLWKEKRNGKDETVRRTEGEILGRKLRANDVGEAVPLNQLPQSASKIRFCDTRTLPFQVLEVRGIKSTLFQVTQSVALRYDILVMQPSVNIRIFWSILSCAFFHDNPILSMGLTRVRKRHCFPHLLRLSIQTDKKMLWDHWGFLWKTAHI